jgi:hypothetical protein
VEYDRATGSAVDQRLTELIREDGPLAVTEPVLMESWLALVTMSPTSPASAPPFTAVVVDTPDALRL